MRTSTPELGQVFAEWMVEQNEEEGETHKAERPEGMPRLTFSQSMKCSRQLGYKVAGLEPTDPMDGSSLAVTRMGRLLHEEIQEAVISTYLTAECETIGTVGDLIWGYVDIDNPELDEVVEIKTVGAFAFDMAIGLTRSPGKGKPAYIKEAGGQGPRIGDICQGGFNAVAHGRKNVRIIYLSREAVSIGKAEQAGLGSVERFWAEWLIPFDDWMPLVQAETERLAKIRADVESGLLPQRMGYDERAGKFIQVDPEKWPLCGYCPQQHRCKMDGPGLVPVALSRST